MQPSAPRRPVRVVVAAVLIGGAALVAMGLLAVNLWALDLYTEEFADLLPLFLLPCVIGWLGFLAYGLLTGRRRVRFAAALTLPFTVLFCGYYVSWLAPLLIDDNGVLSITDERDLNSVAAVMLCVLEVLLSVPPLFLLIGRDVRAYVRRPRTTRRPAGTPAAGWPGR